MQSIAKLLLTIVALMGLSVPSMGALPARAASPIATQVAQAEPCHVSLLGPVTAVISPTEFAIEAPHVGNIHVYDHNARMNTHGLALRPGTFAGVYGCYGPGRRSFNAEEVTLASSQSAYASYNQPPSNVQIGPCHESVFGTITSVRGPDAFTIQELHTSRSLYVDHRDALTHANGVSLAPGAFVGLYGCFERAETVFKAEELTLASSAQAYANIHQPVTLSGVIDEVRNGMIGVRTPHVGHIHVLTSQTGFRAGESVTVHGTFDPVTGTLNASSVTVT